MGTVHPVLVPMITQLGTSDPAEATGGTGSKRGLSLVIIPQRSFEPRSLMLLLLHTEDDMSP